MSSGGLGGHDYHTFVHNNEKFLLTFGDCESRESRRFLNSLTEPNINQLFDSIIVNIWEANKYGVQNKIHDTYLLGQDSTQEFIHSTATNTTFWGLVPFNSVCLANVSFYPYSCGIYRWNIELDFGSAAEYNFTNHDPNSKPQNSSNQSHHSSN